MKKFKIIILALIISLQYSCKDNEPFTQSFSNNITTRAIPTPSFDWENADWMPTPNGQSRIPSPWIGQGSIAATWGIDVINDRKKADGWELVYNTFDEKASGFLTNPYFIIYNKYRGLIRIYLYITTQFIATSSYIQDEISILSNTNTSLFNFMSEGIIDPTSRNNKFSQIQPGADDSAPLASNKWYMIQYELAYDENIYKQSYDKVQMNLNLNYYNIQSINLGGTITGSIKSNIGSSQNSFFSALGNVGTVVGTGVIAGIGEHFLDKGTINSSTGENKLGLPKEVFKPILQGVKSAISSSSSKLPGAMMNVFNSILGGTSNGPMLNLMLDAKIKLEGTGKDSGSFPSTPISFWLPGFTFPSTAIGYIPLYTNKLGIFNVTDKISINVGGEIYYTSYPITEGGDPDEINQYFTFGKNDFSSYLKINPEILKDADVVIRKQDLILWFDSYDTCDVKGERTETIDGIDYFINPTKVEHYYAGDFYHLKNNYFAVRFTIDVKPHNGTPVSTITKTFKITPDYSNTKIEYKEYD